MDELQLVNDCLHGNHASEKLLYEHFAPKMLGVCYRYAQSHEEAEDMLQESFITVFRKLNQFSNKGNLGGWIRKIVVNTSLNHIKARHSFMESINVIQIDYLPNQVLQQPYNDRDLIELIRALPTGYKTVFNLFAIEGYSHEEIAGMLHIKASTSRSQFVRARELLKKKLGFEIEMNKDDERHG